MSILDSQDDVDRFALRTVFRAAVAAAAGLLVTLPILAIRGSLTADQALQGLQVLISWPVAAFGITLYLGSRFRAAIDSLLRFGTIKLPGVEVTGQQPPAPNTDAAAVAKEVSTVSITSTQELEARLDAAGHDKVGLEKERDQARALFNAAMQQSTTWRFRFLSQFFIPTTKRVLTWFVQRGVAVTQEQFNSQWVATIDANQRAIILEVLHQYGMLRRENGFLSATPDARSFLDFVGYTPNPDPAPIPDFRQLNEILSKLPPLALPLSPREPVANLGFGPLAAPGSVSLEGLFPNLFGSPEGEASKEEEKAGE